MMKAINPATGELIQEYPTHSDQEVQEILEQAEAAFQSLRNTDFRHRAELMKKAAGVLEKNKGRYAKLISLEMGKPITQAAGEVDKCIRVCNYYADNAESMLADEPAESDGSKAYVAFQPLGVILAVMPWNYPMWQVFRFAAPSLMAGNAGVLKHASNVPGAALAIEEVFREAGFPENVFRTLMIGARQVDAVIESDVVKAVTLTGSEAAGTHVVSTAAKIVKKAVLELGGSDPFIVLDDVDVETCAVQAVNGRMLNAGQSCIAAKRFIVVDEVADRFVEKFHEAMERQVVGDPLDEKTTVGPLAKEEFVEDLVALVEDARAKGATIVTGGSRPDGPGAYLLPTIVDAVSKGMRLYDEEAFGPVASVIRVADEIEAIAVANGSRFGLGGSVWTKDKERGERVARQVESGAVFVNGVTKSDPRLPFGGIKKSGYGRELSHYGIREFVNIKTIWVA
jgi:succinate-semialdehyde dehydrogenase/glutarate-semialdehyde dehydrogenase